MKLTTQKTPFCDEFSIIKSVRSASISSFSKLFIAFLLIFSSNFDALSVESNNQQVPVKKTVPTPAKSASSKKVKSKVKGKKTKKSVIVKKDTLLDIDPASTKSPLYNN